MKKKRYCRLQKAMGDMCLLAGSPLDAMDHYNTAIELGRATGDHIYLGAAILGCAEAKVGVQRAALGLQGIVVVGLSARDVH